MTSASLLQPPQAEPPALDGTHEPFPRSQPGRVTGDHTAGPSDTKTPLTRVIAAATWVTELQ